MLYKVPLHKQKFNEKGKDKGVWEKKTQLVIKR